MSMVVQHNLTAMNANRMLGITTGKQAKATEKLSSGYKINRAADDAAGLSISEKMRKQIRGLTQASVNAQDGISAVQTAEGALTEVHDMLQRMNELAVKASNGTNSETDRQSIQDEIDQLVTEIDRVSETTKFNETYLLKGKETGASTEMKTNAHDAGIVGKLVDNGSTATFSLDKELEDGDKIKIAGEEYTIGGAGAGKSGGAILDPDEMNTDTTGYAISTDAAFTTATLAAGDSVTYDGKTYSLVDKLAVDDIAWATGDTFKIGDHFYKIAAANGTQDGAAEATAQEITEADAKKAIADALAEGKQVTGGTTGVTVSQVKDGTNANANARVTTGVQIVASLEKGEISTAKLADLKVPTVAKAGATDGKGGTTAVTLKAGDSVTAGGVTTTATAAAATAAKDAYDAIDALVAGNTVKIGTDVDAVTYTIVDEADVDEAAFKLTKEEILAKIHDGDTVSVNGGAAMTVIGDIGLPEKEGSTAKTISASEAYDMIAKELQTASSIGTDEGKEATVTGDGKGNFTITKGTATVKESLSFNLHVGADADMTNKINVTIDAMSAVSLGVRGLDAVGRDENGKTFNDNGVSATYAIDVIADAISKVSAQRSALGAVQNRLEHTINNLDNVVENTTSAESQIRDTDMATQMVEYSKNQILAQAGQSMLAQANQSNQGVLSLLQ